MSQVSLKDLPDINLQDSLDEELRFQYPSAQLQTEVEALEAVAQEEKPSQQTLETACRLHEENTFAVKGCRFDNQEGLEIFREGKPLRDFKFLELLNKIVPARFTHLNRPGVWRLECLRKTEAGGEFEYATAVQYGRAPEYSTFYFDAHNLPTSEMYRGWRTSLIEIIRKGFITEQQAEKVFRMPTGPESWRYRKMLYELRNGGNNAATRSV